MGNGKSAMTITQEGKKKFKDSKQDRLLNMHANDQMSLSQVGRGEVELKMGSNMISGVQMVTGVHAS